jgi:hypothetical protein
MKLLNVILVLWGLIGSFVPFLQTSTILGVYAIIWAILLLVVFFATLGAAGSNRAFFELFVYAIIFGVFSFLGSYFFNISETGLLYFGSAGVMIVSTVLSSISE